jgi:hypothetical protein
MKAVAIGYCPSPNDSRFPTAAFLKNLRENPPAGDLILFSDHPHAKETLPANAQFIQIGATFDRPELKQARITNPRTGQTTENRAAINNLIFFTAVRIAERQSYTHLIYLEADVRVKNHSAPWDQVLFKEFFNHPRHLLAGGTVVVYNAANFDRQTLERFYAYLDETKAMGRKMPIPPYGWLPAGERKAVHVFCNGAGSIFSIAGLNLLFPERLSQPDTKTARESFAWDFCYATRGWERFGPDIFNVTGYLPSEFSSYGDTLSTESERLAWLNDGTFTLIHQCKSSK